MTTNVHVHGAVYMALYAALYAAVAQAVNKAVYVYGALWRAVSGTVERAEDWAVFGDPSHPSLVDFLAEVDQETA